jgi:hypothetical protein
MKYPSRKKATCCIKKFPIPLPYRLPWQKKKKNNKIEKGSSKTDSFGALFVVERMPIFRLKKKKGALDNGKRENPSLLVNIMKPVDEAKSCFSNDHPHETDRHLPD